MDVHAVAPTLVIGVGNPSRGDDALGPAAIERLEGGRLQGVELLTDFQLMPEHALDLIGRDRVVFIDASVAAEAPFTLERIAPAHDDSATTHALSPAAVLETFDVVTRLPLPEAYVLAIRGYEFDLGAPLSAAATANLEQAVVALLERLRYPVAVAVG